MISEQRRYGDIGHVSRCRFLFCTFYINRPAYCADDAVFIFREQKYYIYKKYCRRIKGEKAMTVKERILTIRLIDKAGKNPDCARRLGVEVTEPDKIKKEVRK